jgi:uncharacterized protein YggE
MLAQTFWAKFFGENAVMNLVQFRPLPTLTGIPRTRFGQEPASKTLVIQQSAQVEKMPDSLQVGFPILLQGADQKAVIAKINEKTEPLVKALKELNLPKLKVTTSALSIHPKFETDTKGRVKEPRKIIGYEGSQQVIASAKGVPAKELSSYASQIVSTGLNNGANGVQGPYTALSNRERAEESAITKAVKLATRLAKAAAKAAGLELGEAKQVQIGGDQNNYYPRGGGMKMGLAASRHGAESAPEVSEGSFEINPETVASPPVTVQFEMHEPKKPAGSGPSNPG